MGTYDPREGETRHINLSAIWTESAYTTLMHILRQSSISVSLFDTNNTLSDKGKNDDSYERVLET